MIVFKKISKILIFLENNYIDQFLKTPRNVFGHPNIFFKWAIYLFYLLFNFKIKIYQKFLQTSVNHEFKMNYNETFYCHNVLRGETFTNLVVSKANFRKGVFLALCL